MKMQAFNAVCPLEIGDEVIIRQDKTGKTAYYLPEETKQIPGLYEALAAAGEKARLTDIAVIHYAKSQQIEFRYEFDNSGMYEPMKIVTVMRKA